VSRVAGRVEVTENVRHLSEHLLVVLAVPGFVEVVLVVQSLLVEEGENRHPPAVNGFAIRPEIRGTRESPVRCLVIMNGDADLLEVVFALTSPREPA